MLTCRDQQAAAYKGSRKINRPATHPIHFAADSPGKIIAALRKRGPTPNPAHGSHLTVRTATACRAYITSPRSYRTDRRYNDQNECSIDP